MTEKQSISSSRIVVVVLAIDSQSVPCGKQLKNQIIGVPIHFSIYHTLKVFDSTHSHSARTLGAFYHVMAAQDPLSAIRVTFNRIWPNNGMTMDRGDSHDTEPCLYGELAKRAIEVRADSMGIYQVAFYPDSNVSLDGPGYEFDRFEFDPADIGFYTHLALHEFLCKCVRKVGGDLSVLTTIDEEAAIKALFVSPISVAGDASARFAAAAAGPAADSAASSPGVATLDITPPPPSPGV